MFLPQNKIDIFALKTILPYVNLLLINMKENLNDEINYYDKGNFNSVKDRNNKNTLRLNEDFNYIKIRRENYLHRKQVRLNPGLNYLKQQGKERYQRALDFTNSIIEKEKEKKDKESFSILNFFDWFKK